MTISEDLLRRWCEAWPGVTVDVKWDDDLVFMVGGKMFCAYCLSGSERHKLSFKVEPERFLELTGQPGFRPAPYLARAHWVTVDSPQQFAGATLRAFLRRAYELVRARLPKRQQRELEALEPGDRT